MTDYFCYLCSPSRLYGIDTFKDRVQWLIVVIFKLVIPTYIVVMCDRSAVQSYKAHTDTHYTTKMHLWCEEYKSLSDASLMDMIDDLHLDPAAARKHGNVSASQQAAHHEGEIQTEHMIAMIEEHNKLISNFQPKPRRIIVTEKCCNVYRRTVNQQLKCLSEQGSKTSALSFTLTMYCPLIATVVLAFAMAPVKFSTRLQKILLVNDDRPSVQLTAKEKMRRVQNWVQFAVELAAFHCIAYKAWALFDGLVTCTKSDTCIPAYKSDQIRYLILIAHGAWLNMIWTFVYM